MRRAALGSVAMGALYLMGCNVTPPASSPQSDRDVAIATDHQQGARQFTALSPGPAPSIPPGPISETPTINDKVFIDGQVPHHQQMVILADQAIARAQSAELKHMAQMMKENMLKQIKQLKDWRKAWFGSAETPPVHVGMIPDIPAGKDFDARWSEVVVFHHQGAIAREQQLLTSPARKELQDMARKDIPMESAEIEKLERFFKPVSTEDRVKFEDFISAYEQRLGLLKSHRR